MYSYQGLVKKLKERDLKKSDFLIALLRISSRTLTKISKREKLADIVYFHYRFERIHQFYYRGLK